MTYKAAGKASFQLARKYPHMFSSGAHDNAGTYSLEKNLNR